MFKFYIKNREEIPINSNIKNLQLIFNHCFYYYYYLGTSDEHITVMENLKTVKCDGAIIVTTPQQVSIEDVRKEITFCRKTGIPIVGLVENMSG